MFELGQLHRRAKQVALCIVLLATSGLGHANDFNHYIVGGRVVNDDAKYPFMASVLFDRLGSGAFTPGCGGTLISDRFVLTAAHCIYNNDFDRPRSADRIAIYVGETNLSSDDGRLLRVKQVLPHPDYDRTTSRNDIGLIELESPYSSASVAVIPTKNSSVPVLGEPGLVMGWGAISEGGGISTRLREVTLPVISNARCFPYYVNAFDSRLGFCAGGDLAGGRDSCQGDSGGPLLVLRNSEYVVAGIISYGQGCGRSGVPGVYTRVENYSEWIKSFTENTFEYSGQTDAPFVEETTVVKLDVNTSINTDIRVGQVAYYDVTGARQVNLTSHEGDADMFIIDDANFEEISSELVRCASQQTTPLDLCVIDENSGNAYAVVFGFSDADYTISTQLVVSNPNGVQPFGVGAQSSSGGLSLGSINKPMIWLLLGLCFIRLSKSFGYNKSILRSLN